MINTLKLQIMNIGQRKITLKSNTESILDHYLNFYFRLELHVRLMLGMFQMQLICYLCSFGMLEEKDVSSH